MIHGISLHYSSLFFWMGSFVSPHNPKGFPDTFPFSLLFDDVLGLFSQQKSTELENLLARTYAFGSTVGNAMDDSQLGHKYCEDFLAYGQNVLTSNCRILEIGAGRGYLASRLLQIGYDVTALEPGEINRQYWQKYDVEVIQELFPSKNAQGPYDAIIFYGVLEHIHETGIFLRNVVEHLTPGGIVLLSVPNCTDEIATGDPSMLLHEHYHYFTVSSLQRCLAAAGLDATVQTSGYGRTLYAAAKVDTTKTALEVEVCEMEILRAYPEKCRRFTKKFHEQLAKVTSKVSLGIYCPSRALAVLPPDEPLRFFDDAPEFLGKYYPPFKSRIESREELFQIPPDELWIMSRTFGDQLRGNIVPYLQKTKIVTLDELVLRPE